ncbi:hypothetical protein RRG08_005107 [Elysia crispata]|uniref:Uncharacterized protein n=1 Tax=Elysia crispata TaxID=231223 RepID=A0AAE1CWW1_9GAST|nr:hypothetical protein RRG08_005107 [Elysia crispata]
MSTEINRREITRNKTGRGDNPSHISTFTKLAVSSGGREPEEKKILQRYIRMGQELKGKQKTLLPHRQNLFSSYTSGNRRVSRPGKQNGQGRTVAGQVMGYWSDSHGGWSYRLCVEYVHIASPYLPVRTPIRPGCHELGYGMRFYVAEFIEGLRLCPAGSLLNNSVRWRLAYNASRLVANISGVSFRANTSGSSGREHCILGSGEMG